MKTDQKKIAVLTGTRAEYGLLKLIMEKIHKSNLGLLTLVTGSHLNESSGYTFRDIIRDGFKIDAKISMYPDTKFLDSDIPIFLSRGLNVLTKTLQKLKPSILLILGDRGESLMGAIAATYLNIPIAHIHGGDQCAGADIDDNIRHAITKLAHIHFPATPKSAKRIRGLGEESWRINLVGAPGLDFITHDKNLSAVEISNLLNLNLSEPIIILLQHCVSSEVDEAKKQIEETLRAIIELKFQTIIVYPNMDPGNQVIIKAIEKYKNYPFLQIHKSLPRDVFLGLMKVASVIVGNSSSAIIEAPSLKLPAVNIGTRQTDRERGDNLIDVSHNKNEIKRAILKSINDKNFKTKVNKGKNPYGDGKSAERIVKVLSKIKIDAKLLKKKFILINN